MKSMEDVDINKLLNDRDLFNSFVYTPIDVALRTLQTRREVGETRTKVENLLDCDVPPVYKDRLCASMFRQVATPNFEIMRFISLAEGFGLHPVILEYTSDLFVSNNKLKHALGHLYFHCGLDHTGSSLARSVNIVDFNSQSGQPISDIRTLWDQSLVEFHHDLLTRYASHADYSTFDASQWFLSHGNVAEKYYFPFLSMFLSHSLLFENFSLDDRDEVYFLRSVFLPSLIHVRRHFQIKPIIVNLEPSEYEDDTFWMSHDSLQEEMIPIKSMIKS